LIVIIDFLCCMAKKTDDPNNIRKQLDLNKDVIKTFNFLAVEHDLSLKAYMEKVLVDHVQLKKKLRKE
jgi:hypothetical protein